MCGAGSRRSPAARALWPPAWLGRPRRPVAGHRVVTGSAAADVQRTARKLAEPAWASACGDSSPSKMDFFSRVSMAEGQSRRRSLAFQRAPQKAKTQSDVCAKPHCTYLLGRGFQNTLTNYSPPQPTARRHSTACKGQRDAYSTGQSAEREKCKEGRCSPPKRKFFKLKSPGSCCTPPTLKY